MEGEGLITGFVHLKMTRDLVLEAKEREKYTHSSEFCALVWNKKRN